MKYRAALSVGSIRGPDAPAVGLDEALADSQAKTNSAAASFVTALYLIKTIKDPFD